MPADAVLRVRDLAVEFDGDAGTVSAVKALSFDLSPGQTLAIVGESGSGKSVSAQAIMGILPRNGRITAGSILFRDPVDGRETDIAGLDRNGPEIRSLRGGRIAMIFQEPMTSLSPLHTVGDQVTEAVRLHRNVDQRAADAQAMAIFEKVGFRDPRGMLKTYPFELSGGMRQRAMIAMALVCRPAILIADEPTTALDVTTQAQILQLMKDLQDEFSMALLLITHDLGVVANMADEIVVMYRGEVMERGSREDIFRRGEHPYLKALMQAVPRFDMDRDERLTPIREVQVSGLDVFKRTATPPPAEGRTVLAIEEVSKEFTLRAGWFGGRQSKVQALTSVSLSVPAGKTVGLVGESGSGKTTLAKILMRAFPPESGRVMFDDGSGPRDIATLSGADLTAYRRAVQFVFQDPFSSLNPRMTVYDILVEPLRVHHIGTEDERFERVKALLAMVGLDVKHLRRYPHSFSGGQRQRIGLARALALGPSVILCDEPTSALDVSVQAQVLNLLKDLQKALGLSFLFVSHNLAVVDYMADQIAVMCRGHIVEQAPRDALFRDPRHPYTQALLSAVPNPDLDHPLDISKVATGAFSNPEEWPEPFTIRPGIGRPSMIEVGAGHRVRYGAARVTEPLRKAS